MNSPSTIDGALSAELTHLRQQVRELQEALAHSKRDRRLAQASALETAQVGTWTWEADTNRVSWSVETEQIFGLLPGSFDGTYEGFFGLVHADDRQRLSTAIATAIDERTFYLIEHHIITPHGDTRWVACRGRALCRENGSLSGMVGTVEDITTRKQSELAQQAMHDTLEAQVRERTTGLERAVIELTQEVARRQQAESALKASEQRYHSLYEHNPFMYFTLASDGIVLSVNRFGAEQLGYQEEDLIGQSIVQVFHLSDHHTVLERLTACVASPYTLLEWETQKIRKDGTRLWVKERARAVHDHTGMILVLVVCEDITERKRTEKQLQETSRLLRTLVNESALPLVSLDREGRVLSWNQAATCRFGWSEEEVLGRELPYAQAGKEAMADALWGRGIRGELIGPIELRRQRKDGQVLDLLLWPVFVYDEFEQVSLAVGCIIRDVTESRLIESHVRENEARWRALYEHAGVGIAELALDGRFLRVNPHLCKILGYSSEAMLERNFQDLTHPDDIQTNLAYLAELLAGKRHSFSMEKRYRRIDHTWVWVDLTVSLVHTVSSDHAYLIAVIQNIDDRKRSHSLLQAAMDSVADGLLIVDRQGKVTRANQRFLALWNIPDELANCQDDDALVLSVMDQLQDQHAFLDKVRQLYAHPEEESLDVLHFKDGRVFKRHSRPQILDREIVGRVWTFRDVTKHKRAEEALRESELMLQRFVAEAPVGLCILDKNWRAICTNRALCELTGYEEDEIIGSTYALYTHPEDLSANIVLTDEFFRGLRSSYTYEKRYIRKSGEIIWVAVKATRIELSGHEGPLLLAAVQDITERKLAMEEREQLSRDLHDNLLQALYAVGMQLEAGKLAMKHSARRSKTHMSRAVTQLNNLMVDVRRFIALLTRRPPTELDFGQALNQLITSMTGTDQTAPELDIKSPVLSFITPQLAEQLLNITREALSNSMRHAHASHRWVQLSLIDNSIRLVIGDNGVGFVQTRRRRTGHGLSNMAARAQRMFGTFTLQSTPRRGTMITVDVPLKKGAVYE